MRYLLSLLIAAAAYSQSAAAPRFGFTTEGNQLLPVWGVPGAARLGDATNLDDATRILALHPTQDLALAVRHGETGLLGLLDGSFLALSSTPAALAAWSPSGKALALAAGGQVEVYTRAANEWTRLTQAPGQPGSLAVSDDGHYLLTRAAAELTLWHDGSSQIVAANATAFAFAAAGHAFAYQSGGEIVFSNAELAEKRLPVEGDLLLASAGPNLLSLRSAEAGSILELWSPTGDVLETSHCPCQADRLSPSGNGWLRLHTASGGPLWMTDGKQIFFIPATAPAAATEEGNN